MFRVFETVAGATREGGTPLRVCPMSGLQGASGHSEPPLLHPSGTTPGGGGDRPTTLPRLLRHRKSTRGRTTHPQLGGGRNRSGGRPLSFPGRDLQQFTTWLDYLAEETGRPLTVLAHNFRAMIATPSWRNTTVRSGCWNRPGTGPRSCN